MKQYLIDDKQLRFLASVAIRLYTEKRLSADEMRDIAHTLTAVVERCRQIEIPEDVGPSY